MTCTSNFAHLASYNQWMNRKLYNAASVLSVEQLTQNRGAFFGSILGTLNHIAVGDILWLKRIAGYYPNLASLVPLQEVIAPTALDQQICADFAALTNLRSSLDEVIVNLSKELSQEELDAPFEYTSTKGIKGKKLLGEVLLHFFNHQTHHRGQVTTLFSQLGIDVGATDLILLIPNQQ
jgi:uncharacterized damage-inducible protein DinB